MGGMSAILELMVLHESQDVRKVSARTFNTMASNNIDVQTFAMRAGAVNLAAQVEREATPAMRELLWGTITQFIKGENFEGKKAYIMQGKGLEQVSRWLAYTGE